MSKSGGKIFFAGLLGAMAGAVGGLLLAPKSGKEMRENIREVTDDLMKKVKTTSDETKTKVKEVFGNASTEAMNKYKEISTAVVNKVAAVKTAGTEIDKEKYGMIVEDIVSEFKEDFVTTKNGAARMATLLKKDWEKIKKALVA